MHDSCEVDARTPRPLFHARQIRALKWFNVATMAICVSIALTCVDPSGVRYATAYDEQYAATRAVFATLLVYVLQITSTMMQCDIFESVKAVHPGTRCILPCRRYLVATAVVLTAWMAAVGWIAATADGEGGGGGGGGVACVLQVAVVNNAFALAQLLLAASQATYWARNPIAN